MWRGTRIRWTANCAVLVLSARGSRSDHRAVDIMKVLSDSVDDGEQYVNDLARVRGRNTSAIVSANLHTARSYRFRLLTSVRKRPLDDSNVN